MPPSMRSAGFGSRLIKTLARQLQADVTWRSGDPGTVVEVRAPIRSFDEVPAHG